MLRLVGSASTGTGQVGRPGTGEQPSGSVALSCAAGRSGHTGGKLIGRKHLDARNAGTVAVTRSECHQLTPLCSPLWAFRACSQCRTSILSVKRSANARQSQNTTLTPKSVMSLMVEPTIDCGVADEGYF